MDSIKAAELETVLSEQLVGDWTIHELIDHGKSAAVFRGSRNGQTAAIKIFDGELIERYGDKTQQGRIDRELALVGSTHPNLVTIYGGGFDETRKLYFVVMEYLNGPNLRKFLPGVASDMIPHMVEQLAAAAQHLEAKGLVHRDIKPENIVVLDEGARLVLLDLGVIRPIGVSGLTDPSGILSFIGTLQYSSPEFLLRQEVDDENGWRALTFYQIGAVLHDLITKKPIFEQYCNPYAALVNAVQFVRPIVRGNPNIPPEWSLLAEKCLIKDPTTRLSLLNWSDFQLQSPQHGQKAARDRVRDQLAVIQASSEIPERAVSPVSVPARQLKKQVFDELRVHAIAARSSSQGLPPISTVGGSLGHETITFTIARNAKAGLLLPLGFITRVDVQSATEQVVRCESYVGSSRVDLQACKLEYSIVSPK